MGSAPVLILGGSFWGWGQSQNPFQRRPRRVDVSQTRIRLTHDSDPMPLGDEPGEVSSCHWTWDKVFCDSEGPKPFAWSKRVGVVATNDPGRTNDLGATARSALYSDSILLLAPGVDDAREKKNDHMMASANQRCSRLSRWPVCCAIGSRGERPSTTVNVPVWATALRCRPASSILDDDSIHPYGQVTGAGGARCNGARP